MKKILAIMLSISTIHSTFTMDNQETPKAPTSIEDIDTKDFPYIWQYRNQVEKATHDKTIKKDASQEAAYKVLHHPLCQSLKPFLKNEKERDILKMSLHLASNEPKNIRMERDSEVQKENAKVMTIYNCVEVYEQYQTYIIRKDQINILLAGKKDEQKK